ncbi:hypothetical protein BAUCODRAFT_140978 [Baudoinia panamericana UAMH 10762]|uniref:Uncharacterized protein n=1 Tax=Baudoinia panamericana (strain UAMH 10762) TaxID=717646 RepID=M2LKA6_BAUPA|nr:uncharacterized protein BAUCODRAFT_140978 [Baudoinia panamericana UAMH 10762]EMC94692.1 hypothetical protein BAUCODRAFT_140978 [Baudoinia panamericana UAMH 10762]
MPTRSQSYSAVDIVRYALTLEHLEDKFYREGFANFTVDHAHETAHLQFITAALHSMGQTPTMECAYAFGITSVDEFVATAGIFEGIGQAAYAGAATQIAHKQILAAGLSIATVEARPNAYLRASLAQSPFSQKMDDELTPDLHRVVSGWQPTCPVKAFPGNTIATTGTIISGQVLSVHTEGFVLKAADANAHLYAAFMTATGADCADGINLQITVPTNVNGQSYLLMSNCNTTVNDNCVTADPTYIEISILTHNETEIEPLNL